MIKIFHDKIAFDYIFKQSPVNLRIKIEYNGILYQAVISYYYKNSADVCSFIFNKPLPSIKIEDKLTYSYLKIGELVYKDMEIDIDFLNLMFTNIELV